ncbi:SWAP (Suppressor-of-White-APricot)/surp domain-containing protein / ubiquitin family protein [Rhynchospora pubera]|uniref:SWAP (Suppressor-of-White-APricot)/surp domain-containing protein / ubiquitin family protein n=1 Tax=Rhynchospora pubera TaxID=906938 RepID=A0AAV8GKJ4_9POAL|nr:SWAP (Suppressor-of-White-APricot)/surp domain-containing protein / ubiquitin family protein [Rhynchospora pubera]
MSMAAPILPLPAPDPDNSSQNQSQSTDNDKDDLDPPTPAPAPVATHTRTIGIIYPPPDIKAIVEKTAQYVAKNGSDFERQILAKNAGNPKFNFLIPSDPYHAYYQSRVSTHALQLQNQNQNAPTDADAAQADTDTASKPTSADSSTNDEFRAPVPPKKILDPPPSEQYTVRLPEGITGEELDVIKLTAQFVARNGKAFMEKLIKRVDVSSPQFHFLRPTHSMYTFFTSLADAYSKVLMPEKGLTDKLRNSSAGLTVVLERCLHRLEWEKSQEQERQRAEDEIEQERMQMAMIDWHDFIVVETIEFAEEEDEDLPVPMTLDDVIRRSKLPAMEEPDLLPIDAAAEPGKEMEIDMDDEEIQLVQEGMRAAQLDDRNNNAHAAADDMVEARPPTDEPMRIVKNWKRPEERLPAERDPTKFVVSPITGELIPINEMAEHMRISLIDPKYKEQKDRMMAKIKETTLATDDEISRNIVGLARTRPDIFGTTEEEVSNAVKAEIEKKNDEQPKQVIWDGHSGSIGRTASQALSQNTQAEELANTSSNNLPGPAAPPPRPNIPTLRPLPPPPGLALNMPRIPTPVGSYPAPPASGAIPGPPQMIPSMRPPLQPIPGQPQPMMMARPGMPQMVPPPPGSQFSPVVPPPRPFMPVGMAAVPNMTMVPTPAPPPPLPLGVPPPPPPEEVPPPLPDEPEPKRQKLDDSSLVPEDQFLAQHPGSARILVAVPNLDEGNLKGQVLEISVQSLSETISSLKEKIAGEVQLPANKQKISGKAGFLKDNHSLAYYNIAPGEALTLALRERGGRKK